MGVVTLLELAILAALRALGNVWPLDASGHDLLLKVANSASDIERNAVIFAAELGMVIGVMLYFWRDMAAMASGAVRLTKGRADKGGRLLLYVLGGSLPALVGIIFLSTNDLGWTLPLITALGLVIGGLWLSLTDNLGVTVKRMEHLSSGTVAAFGLVQLLAFLPGISRTAVVIGTGRLLGFERRECLRYSLLMLIPLALAQSLLGLWKLGGISLFYGSDLNIAALVGLFAGLGGVAALMRYIEIHTFKIFGLWMMGFGLVAILILSVWPY